MELKSPISIVQQKIREVKHTFMLTTAAKRNENVLCPKGRGALKKQKVKMKKLRKEL